MLPVCRRVEPKIASDSKFEVEDRILNFESQDSAVFQRYVTGFMIRDVTTEKYKIYKNANK